MTIPGKIEVVVKINQLPTEVRTVGREVQFTIDTGEQIVAVTMKTRTWDRLVQFDQSGAAWVAAIKGKMGERVDKGFVLEQPSMQIFEKKPQDAPRRTESET